VARLSLAEEANDRNSPRAQAATFIETNAIYTVARKG
jgi:hypothetical protein